MNNEMTWSELRKLATQTNKAFNAKVINPTSVNDIRLTLIKLIDSTENGNLSKIPIRFIEWIKEERPKVDGKDQGSKEPGFCVPIRFIKDHFHRLSYLEKAVLLSFMSFADFKTGETFVSVQEVASTIPTNIYQVHKAIRSLQEKRHIKSVSKPGSRKMIRRISLIPFDED